MSEEKKSSDCGSGLNGDPVGSEVRESLWSLISLMKSNVYLCLGSVVFIFKKIRTICAYFQSGQGGIVFLKIFYLFSKIARRFEF